MHLARRLMGQTESKTCIGKGMKTPSAHSATADPSAEAPKRNFRQIGALGSWRYNLGAAASNAATCIRDESAPATSSAEIRRDQRL
jgi:hypothetical protein